MKYIFLLLFGMMAFVACKPKQKMPINPTPVARTQAAEKVATVSCKDTGIVRDMSKKQGCGFVVFNRRTSQKYAIITVKDATFQLRDGQIITYDAHPLRIKSTCNEASMPIELSCVQELKTDFMSGEDTKEQPCIDAEKLRDLPWVDKVMAKYNPEEVYKHKEGDTFWYEFRAVGHRYLYNCKGEFYCSVEGKAMNICTRKLQSLGRGTLIYHLE